MSEANQGLVAYNLRFKSLPFRVTLPSSNVSVQMPVQRLVVLLESSWLRCYRTFGLFLPCIGSGRLHYVDFRLCLLAFAIPGT